MLFSLIFNDFPYTDIYKYVVINPSKQSAMLYSINKYFKLKNKVIYMFTSSCDLELCWLVCKERLKKKKKKSN